MKFLRFASLFVRDLRFSVYREIFKCKIILAKNIINFSSLRAFFVAFLSLSKIRDVCLLKSLFLKWKGAWRCFGSLVLAGSEDNNFVRAVKSYA